MKLKVGDKVRIRKDLEVGSFYGSASVTELMKKWIGKTVTVSIIGSNGDFQIKEDGEYWCWTPEMVKNTVKNTVKNEANMNKLIFRDNATILLKDGKKYVSKCQAGDTYDREKGLLLCLAKANGYTYNDICEMLNNAEYQGYTPYKITLSEFFANKGKRNMAIHCKTEAEANELLKAFDRVGQVWYSGSKYTDLNLGGEDACYTNNNKFYNYIYHEEAVAINGKIKIYEFNEVDLSK